MIEMLTFVSEADAAQVITLAEAKAHLRVTHDAEDERTFTHVDAAIVAAEEITRRPIRRGTWQLSREHWARVFGRAGIRLQGTIASITSIEYRDTDGNLQTIAGTVYDSMIGEHSTLVREAPNQAWPELAEYLENIRVTFVAGYTNRTVPHSIKLAILQLLTYHHDADPDAQRAANDLLARWTLPPW